MKFKQEQISLLDGIATMLHPYRLQTAKTLCQRWQQFELLDSADKLDFEVSPSPLGEIRISLKLRGLFCSTTGMYQISYNFALNTISNINKKIETPQNLSVFL